ncbi:hypothetical protein HW132_28340 [Brasilonema sp. CT11]|nr:hypothetical protein [Brasilonema sp. CT11]
MNTIFDLIGLEIQNYAFILEKQEQKVTYALGGVRGAWWWFNPKQCTASYLAVHI